ncbi:MAG: hypothetical protein IPL79_06740 [Myxococcales bacterium]|nr:hypothetical protein [Myxococcales bacterium]
MLIGACGGCEPKSTRTTGGAGGADGTRPTFTLFALADLRGEIEPCGCTTDPWGDMARTVKVVGDARAAGPVMMVDAGSTLYAGAEVPTHLQASAKLKAELIASIYEQTLRVDAVALGEADLAFGTDGVRLPRLSNATVPGVETKPWKLVEVAGHKLGVVSVVHPGALASAAALPDPAAAMSEHAQAARAAGAELVVVLLQAPTMKDAQRALTAATRVDIAIVGLGEAAPEPEKISRRPERLGTAWTVFPAAKGQTLVRFDITLRAGDGLADAIGPGAVEVALVALDKEIATITAQLAAFRTDASADAAFVARKEAELAAHRAQRATLQAAPLQVPASGSYFTFDLMPISKALACDGAMVAAKVAFDQETGKANLAEAAAAPPVPVAKGQAVFVGSEACANCHKPAMEFWKTTRHAQAWETIEKVGKQFQYDCVSCHVTGWMQPGGSTLAANEVLRDVQCETCHGPGSLHVAAGGGKATMRAPAEDLCAGQCHTPEHSDTFERSAYLRDILGEGHGAAARQALGEGPTGRQLRAAGLAKAGAAIGKGCPK